MVGHARRVGASGIAGRRYDADVSGAVFSDLWTRTQRHLDSVISPAGHRQIQGAHGGQDQASNDVIEEFSKWLEAGEESIFSLEAEKKPGASYELPEAVARTKNFPPKKSFSTTCRIPVWPFVVVVKAGQLA
jgi:hypothetical protein